MSYQESKNDYYTSNKELLCKVKSDLHHIMMLLAYTKYHDKLRCNNYYEENKEQINRRHKEYYEQNKAKLQHKKKLNMRKINGD